MLPHPETRGLFRTQIRTQLAAALGALAREADAPRTPLQSVPAAFPFATAGEKPYATNLEGELDDDKPVDGRRIFDPKLPATPVRQQGQIDLIGGETFAPEGHLVNRIRREVKKWREEGYPHAPGDWVRRDRLRR